MGDLIQNFLIAVVSCLLTVCVGLIIYTYDNDKEVTKSSTANNNTAIEEVTSNVNTLRINLLENIYKESRKTNDSIHSIAKEQAIMVERLNGTIEQQKEDRKLFIEKLEDNSKRIGVLEQDVSTLKKSKLTIFGWESN